MPTTQQKVKVYLREFKLKLDTHNVIFRDRTAQKNAETLLSLSLSTVERREILKTLEVHEYCQGPLEDTLYRMSDLWVFGKIIKGEELYIKITLGYENSSVICISFHKAEKAMTYPFKK